MLIKLSGHIVNKLTKELSKLNITEGLLKIVVTLTNPKDHFPM